MWLEWLLAGVALWLEWLEWLCGWSDTAGQQCSAFPFLRRVWLVYVVLYGGRIKRGVAYLLIPMEE